jgi:hypothetical protein
LKKPLVHKKYLLEKYPGKGGWTYAAIPEIRQDKSAPFGWVKVKGSIDDYELKNYKLMPMGNNQLFLPVKADIRKSIKKQAGDWVEVVLYSDSVPTETPEETLKCLKEAPEACRLYLDSTDGERKAYLDWIYAAKKDETKVKRIAQMIDSLLKGQQFYDMD